jgi:signal transduction histidine kinase
MSEAQASPASPTVGRAFEPTLRWASFRYLAGVLLLGIAYFGAAKLGQSLRYTASVSAIWPPVGLGIAALYLWGLRWWPGVFLGELLVNGQLLIDHVALPFGSLAGQQLGNMAEVVVGAWLLRRLIGPRAALDGVAQVGGMISAAGIAAAISATVGTASMLVGDVIDLDDVPRFWRTWWLGDSCGAIVVIPLVLTWVPNPRAAWRRIWSVEGGLLIASVVALATLGVTSAAPLTYMVFPALIWAAFRFGPAGVTLAVAINAVLTIGITAHKLGAFFRQTIDNRTLSTQLYILVGALTSLFLSALVSERERSLRELAEARRRESEGALEERRRIARELHDSVSQALFSTVLHTRTAQKTLSENGGGDLSARLAESLSAIGELIKRAQREMRMFIFEWGPESIGDGLVPALGHYVSSLEKDADLVVDMEGPDERLPLTRTTQTQLYGIGREALANIVKHADASSAWVQVNLRNGHVTLEVADDGRGFDPAATHPGHYGLESMRSRADEIDGELTIRSVAGRGTVIRVEVPVESGAPGDGS